MGIDAHLTITGDNPAIPEFDAIEKKLTSSINKAIEGIEKLQRVAAEKGVDIPGLDNISAAGHAALERINQLSGAMKELGASKQQLDTTLKTAEKIQSELGGSLHLSKGSQDIIATAGAGVAVWAMGAEKAEGSLQSFNGRLAELQGHLRTVKSINLSEEFHQTIDAVEALQNKWRSGPPAFGDIQDYSKRFAQLRDLFVNEAQGVAGKFGVTLPLENNVDGGGDKQSGESSPAGMSSGVLGGLMDASDFNKGGADFTQMQGLINQPVAGSFPTMENILQSAGAAFGGLGGGSEGQNTLAENFAMIQSTVAEHQGKLSDIVSAAETKRLDFEKMTGSQRLAWGAGVLTQLAASGAKNNRIMFEINKATAAANTVIKGRQAMQEAYTWGSAWGGPPGGAAMAAIAAAFTAQQIAGIQSTEFGGGSGGGGGGGASASTSLPGVADTSVPSVAPAQEAHQSTGPRNITVVLPSDNGPISPQWMRDHLIPALNEAVGDGVTINV